MSDEHFTVDGTLIEHGGQKSFVARTTAGRGAEEIFTRVAKARLRTDPSALYKKSAGQESKLSYLDILW